MNNTNPTVSIGLPVYNGEPYLSRALEGFASQTYRDFELILSDNDSTDGTEEICRDFADRFDFVRYYRNETNIGGFANNNRVIDLATGRFFMLAGHDDLRHPEQLSRLVEVLEGAPEYVLAFTTTTYIDEEDRVMEDYKYKEPDLRLSGPRASQRLGEFILVPHKVEAVYGLIRADALKGIRFGDYADSDRVFVAELSLRGPFHRLRESLFSRRVHSMQSTVLYPSRRARMAWIKPDRPTKIVFPHHRQFIEYCAAIWRSPTGWGERFRCYGQMVKWVVMNWRHLAHDVDVAARDIVRPWVRRS